MTRSRTSEPADRSLTSARAAGLRHVEPYTTPGVTRTRRRGTFVYADSEGKPVRDEATLARIRSLAIPPAWDSVWICPFDTGHIQAVGLDARGRRQYRYHPRWREVRDATKFHRMAAFARALGRIREACDRDLGRPGLPREKVVAAAVRLLETTHVRVGHREYTRANGSYGLTTLRDQHVRLLGDEVRLHFRGKSGQMRDVNVRDRRLARVVRACSDLPGHELFQYVADDGSRHTIDSADVNGYLRSAAGADFTAKDFRTWAGTVLAAKALRELEPCMASAAERSVAACIKHVAARLGNSPAVCRRSYVHPAVISAYLDGTISRIRAHDDEAFVRALVRVLEGAAADRGRSTAAPIARDAAGAAAL